MFCDIKSQLDNPSILKIMVYSEDEESLERATERDKTHCNNDAQYVYGWVDDNIIFGVCAFQIQADKVIINGISVAEHARKRGIGGEMVTALQKKYEMKIEAETDAAAVGFYCKLGFVVSELPKTHDNCRWSCVLSAPR